MKKDKTQKNSLMFSIVLGSICLLAYFGGLWFIMNRIRNIENAYRNAETEISKEQKALAIRSALERNKENIEKLRNFFVRRDDDLKFIEEVETRARSMGLEFEIVSIDPKPDQGEGFKEDLEVRMKASGRWENLIGFVAELEKMSFMALVSKADFILDEPGLWTANIQFEIYKEK